LTWFILIWCVMRDNAYSHAFTRNFTHYRRFRISAHAKSLRWNAHPSHFFDLCVKILR
jgi:hypothetical protein